MNQKKVEFGEFMVGEPCIPILEQLYWKHGNVGGACKLKSATACTFMMETLVRVVRVMQRKAGELKQEDVDYVRAAEADLEFCGFAVAGWLRPRIEQLQAVVERVNRKCELERQLEELRKEWDRLQAELGECQRGLDLEQSLTHLSPHITASTLLSLLPISFTNELRPDLRGAATAPTKIRELTPLISQLKLAGFVSPELAVGNGSISTDGAEIVELADRFTSAMVAFASPELAISVDDDGGRSKRIFAGTGGSQSAFSYWV